ncbi:hypothetical protein BE221DRAFT_56841, partial [Ostreococcus tauri]
MTRSSAPLSNTARRPVVISAPAPKPPLTSASFSARTLFARSGNASLYLHPSKKTATCSSSVLGGTVSTYGMISKRSDVAVGISSKIAPSSSGLISNP